MLDRTSVDSIERVTLLVRRIFEKQQPPRPIGPDDDLGANGLSSLDMVRLMLSVETEFDLKIPEDAMTPANFRSIARIDALVGELLLASKEPAAE